VPAPPPRLLALLLAGVLVLGTAACSSGGGKAASTTRPPRTTTSTTAPTTGSAPTRSTTAPPAVPSEPAATHVAAADRLVNDWQAHNRDDALKVASPQAVDNLFAQDPTGWYRYTYGNDLGTFCDTGEFDEGTCNLRDDRDHYAKVQLTHDPRGWVVDSVVISSNEGAG